MYIKLAYWLDFNDWISYFKFSNHKHLFFNFKYLFYKEVQVLYKHVNLGCYVTGSRLDFHLYQLRLFSSVCKARCYYFMATNSVCSRLCRKGSLILYKTRKGNKLRTPLPQCVILRVGDMIFTSCFHVYLDNIHSTTGSLTWKLFCTGYLSLKKAVLQELKPLEPLYRKNAKL